MKYTVMGNELRRFSAMSIRGLITTALIGAPSFAVAQQAAGKTAASALVGSYIIVAGEKDGEKIPDERIKGSSVRIAENAIHTFDKEQKETYAATYILDTSRGAVADHHDEYHRACQR